MHKIHTSILCLYNLINRHYILFDVKTTRHTNIELLLMNVYLLFSLITILSFFYIFYVYNVFNDLISAAKKVFTYYEQAAHKRYSIVPNLLELLSQSNAYDSKQFDQLLRMRNDAINLLSGASKFHLSSTSIEQIEKYERIFDWHLDELERMIIQDNTVFRIQLLDIQLTELRRVRLELISALDNYKTSVSNYLHYKQHPIIKLLSPFTHKVHFG